MIVNVSIKVIINSFPCFKNETVILLSAFATSMVLKWSWRWFKFQVGSIEGVQWPREKKRGLAALAANCLSHRAGGCQPG